MIAVASGQVNSPLAARIGQTKTLGLYSLPSRLASPDSIGRGPAPTPLQIVTSTVSSVVVPLAGTPLMVVPVIVVTRSGNTTEFLDAPAGKATM
ncbi:MAG: hypothetical protein ACLQOO_31515 [Terriglobia bacterium]